MEISVKLKIIHFILFITNLNQSWSQSFNTNYEFTLNNTRQYLIQDNIIQPEVAKFEYKKASIVDHKGDLNVSVDLLTVPGRGGLDYPIQMTYQSGIKTLQKSTWVGLGWSLDPGSIMRVVNGVPDMDSTKNGPIMRSKIFNPINNIYPEVSDSYSANLPGLGSSILVPLETSENQFNCSKPKFVPQSWKNWKIDYSTAVFLCQRIMSGNFDQFGGKFDQDLYTAARERNYTDISSFTITAENGNRYVFELPLKSDYLIYTNYQYNCSQGGVNGCTSYQLLLQNGEFVEFISNWRLTSILSADYVDVNSNSIPDDADYGNWIKFIYNYPYQGDLKTVRDIRPLFVGGTGDPYGMLTQTTYLSKIETPTHVASFITTEKEDISYLAPSPNNLGNYNNACGTIGDYSTSTKQIIKPLRLDAIELRDKATQTLLSKVVFDYAPKGGELCRYDVAGNVVTQITYNSATVLLDEIGKSTLKGIRIQDGSQNILPGYKFQYSEVDDGFNPFYYGEGTDIIGTSRFEALEMSDHRWYKDANNVYRARTDRMGHFYAKPSEWDIRGISASKTSPRNTNGASAWSLRIIEYPTGAIDSIEYENDQFDYQTDRQNSNLSNPISGRYMWESYPNDNTECGIRVRRISTLDPILNQVTRTYYKYGTGHLPGLPIDYVRNYDWHNGGGIYFTGIFDWSTNEVEYEWISQVNHDNSGTITAYYTAIDDNAAYYNLQGVHNRGAGWPYWFYNSLDRSWIRGLPKSKTQFNSSGYGIRSEVYSYEKHKLGENFITYDNLTYLADSWRVSKVLTTTSISETPGQSISTTAKTQNNADGRIYQIQETNSDNKVRKTQVLYTVPSDLTILNKNFMYGSRNWTTVVSRQTGGSSYSYTNYSLKAQTGSSVELKQISLSAISSNFFAVDPQQYYQIKYTGNVSLAASHNSCTTGNIYDSNERSIFKFASYNPNPTSNMMALTGTASVDIKVRLRLFDENYNEIGSTPYSISSYSVNSVTTNPISLNSPVNYTAEDPFQIPMNANYAKLEVILDLNGNGDKCSVGVTKLIGTASVTLNDVDVVPYVSGVAYNAFNQGLKNLLSQKSIFENGFLVNRAEIYYKDFDGTAAMRIYPEIVKQWRDDNNDKNIQSGEMITTVQFLSYDEFGNPLSLNDAFGITTTLGWGHLNKNKLISWSKNGFTRTFQFNKLNLVVTITDENGTLSTFEYDGFGRLISKKGHGGEIMKEFIYNYHQ